MPYGDKVNKVFKSNSGSLRSSDSKSSMPENAMPLLRGTTTNSDDFSEVPSEFDSASFTSCKGKEWSDALSGLLKMI